jgi:hypothetical protein
LTMNVTIDQKGIWISLITTSFIASPLCTRKFEGLAKLYAVSLNGNKSKTKL